jgi:topoisomerase-4 subunit B
MQDLFDQGHENGGDYTARDIEVLEGLEPVRRRPGMFIGGTDDAALHHLVAELLDNAMDEAVAGHASRIELTLDDDNTVSVADNGRGIPIETHPKYPGKSALEVILTTLHSGGKFANKAYQTAGGLHGVGLSVVNALSAHLQVEVARDRELWRQTYARGVPQTTLAKISAAPNRRGTTIRFRPDPAIFGDSQGFRPDWLHRMARSKAYLFRGVEIRWRCAPALLPDGSPIPASAVFHFPGGLGDFLTETVADRETVTPRPFAGKADFTGDGGRAEWAIAWPDDEQGFVHSYCNTVPTPQGGSHEQGLRAGLLRALRGFADRAGTRRAAGIAAEDLLGGAIVLLSVFLPNPQFQGQTKERLASPDAQRLLDNAIKDHFDHWLSGDPTAAAALLDRVAARAEDRARRRNAKDLARKSATRKLRLPGKLADCSRASREGTEIFLVEGDSAGGSAKAARERETQAVLPLRGKILNVASASADKFAGNQELSDLVQALGCGTRRTYRRDDLRYERVIIMTDADVDGAHIASLLMTFFFRELPGLIADGHLFLAQPPLFRLQQGGKSWYARDEADKDRLVKTLATGKGKIEIGRFKGLGEMPPAQLRDTTMAPASRLLWRVVIDDPEPLPGQSANGNRTGDLVHSLMGRKPELRLRFIQERAGSVQALDI